VVLFIHATDTLTTGIQEIVTNKHSETLTAKSIRYLAQDRIGPTATNNIIAIVESGPGLVSGRALLRGPTAEEAAAARLGLSRGSGAGKEPLHIDIGGEGRYSDAVNVNSGYFGNPPVTSGPSMQGYAGTAGRPIPNVVLASGEALPFADQSIDIITLQNTPIRPGTISEITRVIKAGGEIRLVGPKLIVEDLHKQIAQRVGGNIYQVTINNGVEDILYTNIVVPTK
jgi:hypothetical protein